MAVLVRVAFVLYDDRSTFHEVSDNSFGQQYLPQVNLSRYRRSLLNITGRHRCRASPYDVARFSRLTYTKDLVAFLFLFSTLEAAPVPHIRQTRTVQ
jgi:hypothetical protein